MELSMKGREAIRSETVPLGGDIEEKEILWTWGSSLGSEGFEPHIGHISPGVQTQEDKHP